MTNYFIKLFHVVMIFTQLGCVAANFDHPFDGVKGLLTNQFLGQLARSVPKPSITVRVGTVEYKNGDTIEIKGTKSNVDYPAELTIVNNSGTNLNLTAGTQKTIISGTNASSFTSTNPSLFTLIPGNSTSFTVNFKTNVLGDKVAELSIPNDDLTNSNFKLNLKGVFEPKETFVGSYTLNEERRNSTTFSDSQGRVFIFGGMNIQLKTPNFEVFNSETKVIQKIVTSFHPDDSHSSVNLQNDRILISGGVILNASSTSSGAYLIDMVNTNLVSVGSLKSNRSGHSSTLLNNGKVLIVGGANGINTVTCSAEIFDPNLNTFTSTGNCSQPRLGHASILLRDGKVLIVGGLGSEQLKLNSAELYDPTTGNFSSVGNMNVTRYKPTLNLLANGNVLVIGGSGSGGELKSTEIYNVISKVFTMHTELNTTRYYHTSTTLNNGKILVVGGYDNSASAEIYDPENMKFQLLNLNFSRAEHGAVLLPNGKVAIIGGKYNTPGTKIIDIFYP